MVRGQAGRVHCESGKVPGTSVLASCLTLGRGTACSPSSTAASEHRAPCEARWSCPPLLPIPTGHPALPSSEGKEGTPVYPNFSALGCCLKSFQGGNFPASACPAKSGLKFSGWPRLSTYRRPRHAEDAEDSEGLETVVGLQLAVHPLGHRADGYIQLGTAPHTGPCSWERRGGVFSHRGPQSGQWVTLSELPSYSRVWKWGPQTGGLRVPWELVRWAAPWGSPHTETLQQVPPQPFRGAVPVGWENPR